MANHPNRSTWRSELPAPTPAEIRSAREAAGLTQPAAAELAGLSNYQRWAEYESGARRPSAPLWELWLLRTGRHPRYTLVERLTA
jgi:DNA-binding transcriptional regulator YiaG